MRYNKSNANPTTSNIHQGDILLSYGSSTISDTHFRLAQAIKGGKNNSYHVAMGVSDQKILHVNIRGIVESDFNEYIRQGVFRCRSEKIAQSALEAGRLLSSFSNTYKETGGKYGLRADFKTIGFKSMYFSPFTKSLRSDTSRSTEVFSKLNTGKNVSLFCASFIATCYQMALDKGDARNDPHFPALCNTFKFTSHSYTPSYLWHRLEKSSAFEYVGKFRDNKWHS